MKSFTVDAPADWAQGRATFGGLVAAYALHGMGTLVDSARPLRSLLFEFVAPVAPGPATVTYQVLRAGRSVTSVQAQVSQHDQVCAYALGAYGASRQTSIELDTTTAPSDLPMLEGMGMPYVEGIIPSFTRGLEYRYDANYLPFSGAKEGRIEGALRIRGDQKPNIVSAVAMLDAWPAPVLPLATKPVPASSLTWMVNIVCPSEILRQEAGAWWRFHSEATVSTSGYAEVQGELWSMAGKLVATSRQMVAEFS